MSEASVIKLIGEVTALRTEVGHLRAEVAELKKTVESFRAYRVNVLTGLLVSSWAALGSAIWYIWSKVPH